VTTLLEVGTNVGLETALGIDIGATIVVLDDA